MALYNQLLRDLYRTDYIVQSSFRCAGTHRRNQSSDSNRDGSDPSLVAVNALLRLDVSWAKLHSHWSYKTLQNKF